MFCTHVCLRMRGHTYGLQYIGFAMLKHIKRHVIVMDSLLERFIQTSFYHCIKRFEGYYIAAHVRRRRYVRIHGSNFFFCYFTRVCNIGLNAYAFGSLLIRVTYIATADGACFPLWLHQVRLMFLLLHLNAVVASQWSGRRLEGTF